MFGEKSQLIAKRFEPFNTLFNLGQIVAAGLGTLGITGVVVMAAFTDHLTWFWNAFGWLGAFASWLILFVLLLIGVRLAKGLFHTWRGAVGLSLIAIAIIVGVAGVILFIREKMPAVANQSVAASVETTADKAGTNLSPSGPIGLLVTGAGRFEDNKVQIGRSTGRIEFQGGGTVKGNEIGIQNLEIGGQPQPDVKNAGLKILKTSDKNNKDGSIISDALIEIVTPTKISKLVIQVLGKDITDMVLLKEDLTSPIRSQPCGFSCRFVETENPLTRYVLRVTTKNPNGLTILARGMPQNDQAK